MKISFVIPFHNEEQNCYEVITRVINYASTRSWDFEIIPVDDRSIDRTKTLLKRLARKYPNLIFPVYRASGQGEAGNTMGDALLQGTQASHGQLIIWTMGDLADNVDSYGLIKDKLEEGFDLVLASRYMSGGSRGDLEEFKALLSSWGTKTAMLLFGIKVHDITNAFRGFRRNTIEGLRLQSSGFSISPEFAIQAHLKGYKLGEVPTVYRNRRAGVSDFKLIHMSRIYLQMYLVLFLRYKILHQAIG